MWPLLQLQTLLATALIPTWFQSLPYFRVLDKIRVRKEDQKSKNFTRPPECWVLFSPYQASLSSLGWAPHRWYRRILWP